jgi:hypothetical protein
MVYDKRSRYEKYVVVCLSNLCDPQTRKVAMGFPRNDASPGARRVNSRPIQTQLLLACLNVFIYNTKTAAALYYENRNQVVIIHAELSKINILHEGTWNNVTCQI